MKSRLKRKQRIKSDKKVRGDAKDSVRKEYAKIYLIKRKRESVVEYVLIEKNMSFHKLRAIFTSFSF